MVSDILRPGNKVEIKAVQKIERQGSTGEVAHVYTCLLYTSPSPRDA